MLPGLSRTQHACSCHSPCCCCCCCCVPLRPKGNTNGNRAHGSHMDSKARCVCLWLGDYPNTRRAWLQSQSPAAPLFQPQSPTPSSIAWLCLACFPLSAALAPRAHVEFASRRLASTRLASPRVVRRSRRRDASCCFLSNFIFTFSLLLNNICFYAPV